MILFQHSYTKVAEIIKNYEKGLPLLTPGKKKKRAHPVTDIDGFSKDALGRFIYDKLNEGTRS